VTNLHLTSAAADADVIVGSGTKWKANWSAGASATHCNRNSVAGPTAPLQATDGAAGVNGTNVSWYSPPLEAVTIAGAITCSLWTRENATANNVAPTIRIERCSGDGTVLSTIVSETTSHGAGEMATTAGGASDTISVTAANVTDTALSQGDRLRITLWIDDASGQGGVGTMASGGQGEFWVNGPVGSQGQAQLAVTETLIEYVPPSAIFVQQRPAGGSWQLATPVDAQLLGGLPSAGRFTPQLVAFVKTDFTGTGTSKSAPSISYQAGDRILVVGETSNQAATLGTPTLSPLTFAAQGSPVTTGSSCWAHSWDTVAAANGSGQVSITRSGSALPWGFAVYVFRLCDGFAIGAKNAAVNSWSRSVTRTRERSRVVCLLGDWGASSITARAWVPPGKTERDAGTVSGEYSYLLADWPDQGDAGAATYGVTGLTSTQNVTAVAVEAIGQVTASVLVATVTQVTETDIAQAMAKAKLRAVGQPSETDTAQPVAPRRAYVLGQASETDTARPVTFVAGAHVVAQVTETDLARPVTAAKARVLARVVETDAAQAATPRKTRTLVQVVETDSAAAFARAKTRTVGQVTETDTAQPVTRRKTRAVGQPVEIDSAQPVTRPGVVNKVTEADTARAVARAKTRALGQVTETDTARPMVRVKTVAAARVAETDLARTITPTGPKIVAVARVTETDFAQAFTKAKNKAIAQATGSETVLALASRKIQTIGRAIEIDTARSVVVPSTIPVNATSAATLTARCAASASITSRRTSTATVTAGAASASSVSDG
jgi:hypothetical protein